MEFSTADLLTIKEVLSDVLVNVNDLDQKEFTPGWYMRRVKKAIDELNYSTYFLVAPPYDVPMPQSLQIMIPSGAWNLKGLYAYNGDCCTVGTQQTIHHKANFVGNGRTSDKPVGYTSNNNMSNADPLYTATINDGNILFYNTDNGRILLSDSCLQYTNLRIVYNGIASVLTKLKSYHRLLLNQLWQRLLNVLFLL